MNGRIESFWTAHSALVHLAAKCVIAFPPISGKRRQPRDAERVRLAGSEPGSVFGVPAVDSYTAPPQPGFVLRHCNPVQDGELHSSRTELRKDEPLMPVR